MTTISTDPLVSGRASRELSHRNGANQARAAATPKSPAQYLVRRLRSVLFDLRLDQLLAGWASPISTGLRFQTLTLKEAEALVRALEDVIGYRSPISTHPSPGSRQLRLFDIDSK